MATVTVTVILRFKKGGTAALEARVADLMADTRRAQGFIGVRILGRANADEQLIFVEDWETLQHFERYTDWRRSTGFFDDLQKLLAEEPRIDVWDRKVV